MPQTPSAAPANPYEDEISRLQHQLALATKQNELLAAQNTLATTQNALNATQSAALTARFGTPPALSTGDIEGAEHLGGLTNHLLAEAMNEAAFKIAEAAPVGPSKRLVITATPDRRAQIVQGAALFSQLKTLQSDLEKMIDTYREAGGQSLTYDGAVAAIGAVEKLIGVFRADYTVHSVTAQMDALAMQLAVAGLLTSKFASVHIDGLAVSDALPLLNLLAQLRNDVNTLEEIAKSELDPKVKQDIAAVVGRAHALFAIGDAKGQDDKTAFERAALAQQWQPGDIVLFVKPVSTSGVLVRAKSWFSLRNTVHAILSGVIEYAYVSPDNAIEKAGIVKVGRKLALNLKELAKSKASWEETVALP